MEYNLRTVPVYSALANAFAYFKELRQRQHLATFTRSTRTRTRTSSTFVCSDKEKVLPANILSPFASWHRVLKRLTQALPHVQKIQAAQPGGYFCMHGNYVSRNFICVNVMQQKAEAEAQAEAETEAGDV